MSLRVTMLGCGGSTGMPLLWNNWGSCDPNNPKNRRLRPSILIEKDNQRILIDAGPDMRQQMMTAQIDHLDAVIFTHAHADHVHGIDDLRVFYLKDKKPIDIYASTETLPLILQRFPFMFGVAGREGYYDKAFLNPHEFKDGDFISELGIQTFAQDHYVCTSTGIRIGSFAYSTDVKNLDEAAFETLAGIETWIVGGLRREPHIAHAALEIVLQWVDRLKPKRTILTHMNHTMDYETVRASLPPGVEPGYDGLVLEC